MFHDSGKKKKSKNKYDNLPSWADEINSVCSNCNRRRGEHIAETYKCPSDGVKA